MHSKTRPFCVALPYAALLVAGVCSAQTPPNAGTILRDESPPVAPAPTAPVTLPRLPDPTPDTKDTQNIEIKSINITGATVFSSAELMPLLSDVATGSHTLIELRRAAERITQHYRQAGYFLARTYLPTQQILDGVLTIAVLEGKLEKVQLENASRLNDGVANGYLGDLPVGTAARREPVDRALLVLSDVPGVGGVNSRLAAGSNTGDSVLVVNAATAPFFTGRIEGDNHGGLYTGRNRLSASADLNSPMGYGERISARLMTSDEDLLYGRLAGQLPVGSNGWTVGAAVGHTTYELGGTFASLNAVGYATTAELFARYPLVRSTNANLYIQPGAEYRKLRDEVRSTATVTDKHASVASLNLSGDLRDGFLGGGSTRGGLSLVSGRLDFDNTAAEAIDAAAARTAGSYTKVSANIERQQYLAPNLTLLVQARAQWADNNLDSSEKFTLGGPNGVRAYATSEEPGDMGWLGTLELRYTLAQWATLAAFHDAGAVRVNTNPYLATPNSQHRRGNGVGLYGSFKSFDWRASVAWRGHEVGTAEPDKHPRFWLLAGWQF